MKMIERIRSALVLSVAVLVLESAHVAVSANDRETQNNASNRHFDFDTFVMRLKAKYPDKLELQTKIKLFIARSINIFKHNVKFASNDVSYHLSQNEFIDIEPNEIYKRFVVHDKIFEDSKVPDGMLDMPAEDAYKRQVGGLVESFSKSASESSETKDSKGEVNFLDTNFDLESSVGYLKEIEQSSEKVAKYLSRYKSKRVNEQFDVAKQSRTVNHIQSRPGISKSNDKFDPTLVPSKFGPWSLEDFGQGLEYDFVDPGFEWTEDAFDDNPRIIIELLKSIRQYFRDRPHLDPMKIDEPSSVNEPMDIDEDESGQERYDIDWRQSGCISRIKAQQECNSCYAFAVLDAIEYHYCYQKKEFVEFSVQYVVDCGVKSELSGCKGGKLSNVGRFIREFGLITNSLYPYRGMEQQCPFNEEHDKQQQSYLLKPRLRWGTFNGIASWYKWLPRGPVVVGVNIPADFFAYGGGVHNGLDCVKGQPHAMLLVGSGVESGTKFWLLKNTFSDKWGEAGYFRLSMRAPLRCFGPAIVVKPEF